MTVQAAAYGLLRQLGLAIIFGNLGSTQERFRKNFFADFPYGRGLQQAVTLAMGDGYAQATGQPATFTRVFTRVLPT